MALETRQVMVLKDKQFVVCTACQRDAPLTEHGTLPDGWLGIGQGGSRYAGDIAHACSWPCLRNYANDKANAEPVEVSV